MLDETGMDDWDGGPPYVTGPPSDTPRELQFTERLKEVVDGGGPSTGRGGCMATTHQIRLNSTLLCCNQGMELGHRFLTEYVDIRRRAMAELWLQWAARRAYNLHSEISYYN
jgi:hypothetical protein